MMIVTIQLARLRLIVFLMEEEGGASMRVVLSLLSVGSVIVNPMVVANFAFLMVVRAEQDRSMTHAFNMEVEIVAPSKAAIN